MNTEETKSWGCLDLRCLVEANSADSKGRSGDGDDDGSEVMAVYVLTERMLMLLGVAPLSSDARGCLVCVEAGKSATILVIHGIVRLYWKSTPAYRNETQLNSCQTVIIGFDGDEPIQIKSLLITTEISYSLTVFHGI